MFDTQGQSLPEEPSVLKRLLLSTCERAGIFPSRKTPEAKLRKLLRAMRPVSPSMPLVRLGPEGDGGYLVPDDLADIPACYSPGVSGIAGFERDCASRGMEVFLADASVDGPPEQNERFHFLPRYIGAFSSDSFVSLDDWVSSTHVPSGKDLLLQMDIEAYEYEVLLAMSMPLQRRFRIIVVEFHNLHYLWDSAFFRVSSRAISKLLLTHACVHNHPNNVRPPVRYGSCEIPPMLEMTFLRRDRVGKHEFATAFPHPLDRDATSQPSVVLPACFYEFDESETDDG
jgi:hypothetical protein